MASADFLQFVVTMQIFFRTCKTSPSKSNNLHLVYLPHLRIKVRAVADKFYISKQYLCNLFKEYTNISIIKYINILKIHSSIELLSENSLTMAEVAEKSGFNSLSNFSKTFKNVTGVSPLKYSKSNSK